jgi:hypothetical protein
VDSDRPSHPKVCKVTLNVASEGEAQERDAAWREIVSDKSTRVHPAALEIDEIMARAVGAPKISSKRIDERAAII